MSFYIHLILFSFLWIKYLSCNYIFCTSECPRLTVSFHEPRRIPVRCSENANIYHPALICTINYRVDYDAENVYVDLKATNDTSRFHDYNQSEFLTQSIWLGFNRESGQPNITNRQYECRTRDDCARLYYLNTIERLIAEGKHIIKKIHTKLYRTRIPKSNLTRYRCKDSTKLGNRSTILCKHGLCYAQNINIKQSCTNDNTPTLFSDMTYYFPRAITEEREYIEYKCNKNLCNRNMTMELIKKYLRNYTDWYNMTSDDEIHIQTKSSSNHRTISYCFLIVSIILTHQIFFLN
ncbi:hypothetical protein I4U23_023858 [Adineta vaga]|nr:hypothetical protein I4U23_023858 [Adineta vaga]